MVGGAILKYYGGQAHILILKVCIMPEAKFRTTIGFSKEVWKILENLKEENEHLTKRDIIEKSVKSWGGNE